MKYSVTSFSSKSLQSDMERGIFLDHFNFKSNISHFHPWSCYFLKNTDLS